MGRWGGREEGRLGGGEGSWGVEMWRWGGGKVGRLEGGEVGNGVGGEVGRWEAGRWVSWEGMWGGGKVGRGAKVFHTYRHSYIQTYRPSDEAGPRGAFAPTLLKITCGTHLTFTEGKRNVTCNQDNFRQLLLMSFIQNII